MSVPGTDSGSRPQSCSFFPPVLKDAEFEAVERFCKNCITIVAG